MAEKAISAKLMKLQAQIVVTGFWGGVELHA